MGSNAIMSVRSFVRFGSVINIEVGGTHTHRSLLTHSLSHTHAGARTQAAHSWRVAALRKVAVSVVMSVRTEQLGSHCTDFHEIL